MKYYVMSNAQAQELEKKQLLELFHFATIPLRTAKCLEQLPSVILVRKTQYQQSPTHVKFHISCKSQPILQTG